MFAADPDVWHCTLRGTHTITSDDVDWSRFRNPLLQPSIIYQLAVVHSRARELVGAVSSFPDEWKETFGKDFMARSVIDNDQATEMVRHKRYNAKKKMGPGPHAPVTVHLRVVSADKRKKVEKVKRRRLTGKAMEESGEPEQDEEEEEMRDFEAGAAEKRHASGDEDDEPAKKKGVGWYVHDACVGSCARFYVITSQPGHDSGDREAAVVAKAPSKSSTDGRSGPR